MGHGGGGGGKALYELIDGFKAQCMCRDHILCASVCTCVCQCVCVFMCASSHGSSTPAPHPRLTVLCYFFTAKRKWHLVLHQWYKLAQKVSPGSEPHHHQKASSADWDDWNGVIEIKWYIFIKKTRKVLACVILFYSGCSFISGWTSGWSPSTRHRMFFETICSPNTFLSRLK